MGMLEGNPYSNYLSQRTALINAVILLFLLC